MRVRGRDATALFSSSGRTATRQAIGCSRPSRHDTFAVTAGKLEVPQPSSKLTAADAYPILLVGAPNFSVQHAEAFRPPVPPRNTEKVVINMSEKSVVCVGACIVKDVHNSPKAAAAANGYLGQPWLTNRSMH